jgi:hypothetical protein
MKRCLYRRCGGARWIALASFMLACSAPFAQPSAPQQLRTGMLVVTQPPNVLLDGKPDRLSPGARIRASNNMLVLSGTLVGQTLAVRYLREPQGLIHEVWIQSSTQSLTRPPASP